MPPKRASTGATSSSKKARSSAATDKAEDASAPALPRDPRWAPVSGSANADMHYKTTMRSNPAPYSFQLMCQPPFDGGFVGQDEEEDEDEEEESSCDGGKTCLCTKPAAEHPDHPWKFSVAGRAKYFLQHVHCDLRDPDNFSMYTFNDHMAYGVLEVIQNLFLDYQQAADNFREQWAVCEALGLLMAGGRGMEMTMIDAGEQCEATLVLIGRLFLSMLARLERENLLSANSEILNLGALMGIYLIPSQFDMEFEGLRKETLGPKTDKKSWHPHEFASHIVAYARKYDIKLVVPPDVEDIVSEAKTDVHLPVPESNTGPKADPFGFGKALKTYSTKYGGVSRFLSKRSKAGTTPIGGDALDITTWTPAERKKFNFDGKDPFGREEIAALKRGDMLGISQG